VLRSRALYTLPYVPSPIFSSFSNLACRERQASLAAKPSS